ncbi:YigZ family protein [Corynebacterium choanae]|uniref:IMPACT family member YigZ n=1 Tax=Corynebacterium choanae TaxID=1862358 RepID=A0A3G6J4G3_9CORY|nr:IMPACT family member YigZ [Corynebacterium choanae]
MYLLPADEVCRFEFERKKSRFITYAARVEDEASARAFIDEIKHRYPDARHHCSAYRYQVADAQPVERSSDDGEPSGTAGAPMLEVLRGAALFNVAAVVVRYFGGIKLGTGGLVRAYGDGVIGVLAQVKRQKRVLQQLVAVDLAHTVAGKIEADLRAAGFHIADVTYGATVTLVVACDPGRVAALIAQLAACTQGEAEPELIDTTWLELPASAADLP